MAAALTCLLVVVFANINSNAQAPGYQWLKTFGQTEYESVLDMITDSNGNTYIAGWFNDSTIIGTTVFINPPFVSSGILMKLDANGNLTWVKRLSNNGFMYVNEMAFDNTGNLLMTGTFSDTLILGTHTLISAGLEDILVAKYDTAGNPIWAVAAGNVGDDAGFQIECDINNNIIVAGVFKFGTPFTGLPLMVYGNADIFVAKFDANGTVLWSQSCGGLETDMPQGLACDSQGNIYITGKSPFNFNYGTQNWNGFETLFIGKISSIGILGSAKVSVSNWLTSKILGLEKDAGDNFYTSVLFTPNFEFDGVQFPNPDNYRFGLLKFDSSLNLLWIKSLGNCQDAGIADMVTDTYGNCYFVGGLSDTMTFGNNVVFPPVGINHTFIAKTDSSGNGLWLQSNSNFFAGHIAINAGCIYVADDFSGTRTFGTMQATSMGQTDIYVTRLCQSVSGTTEIETRNTILCYPNPAQDYLYFNNAEDCRKLFISDITGKAIVSTEFINPFSLSALNQGLYFISLVDSKGNFIYRNKFLKL